MTIYGIFLSVSVYSLTKITLFVCYRVGVLKLSQTFSSHQSFDSSDEITILKKVTVLSYFLTIDPLTAPHSPQLSIIRTTFVTEFHTPYTTHINPSSVKESLTFRLPTQVCSRPSTPYRLFPSTLGKPWPPSPNLEEPRDFQGFLDSSFTKASPPRHTVLLTLVRVFSFWNVFMFTPPSVKYILLTEFVFMVPPFNAPRKSSSFPIDRPSPMYPSVTFT